MQKCKQDFMHAAYPGAAAGSLDPSVDGSRGSDRLRSSRSPGHRSSARGRAGFVGIVHLIAPDLRMGRDRTGRRSRPRRPAATGKLDAGASLKHGQSGLRRCDMLESVAQRFVDPAPPYESGVDLSPVFLRRDAIQIFLLFPSSAASAAHRRPGDRRRQQRRGSCRLRSPQRWG